MKNKVILLILFLTGIRCAIATEVNCVAGRLCDIIDNPASVKSLTLSGTINAADFDFINNMMTSLKLLDIEKAAVTPYKGERLSSGVSRSGAEMIPAFALFGSTVKSIILPEKISHIGEYAFAASAIEKLIVPAEVTSIGEGAFKDCANLESVEITGNVTDIPDNAFERCRRLADVNLHSPATKIGNNAFSGCTALEAMPIPDKLTSIGAEAFAGSGIKEADLSNANHLIETGSLMMACCDSLRYVVLPQSLNLIPDHAFFNDNNIVGICFDNSTVEEIGSFAMTGCNSLGQLSLPQQLQYIGDHAMAGMTSLSSVDATLLADPPALGEGVWKYVDCHKATLSAPPASVDYYKSAPQWNDFIVLTVSSSETINMTAPQLKAGFNHNRLTVESTAEIVSIAITDISGHIIYSSSPACRSVSADTSGWDGNIFIVSAMLSGEKANLTLKLLRQQQ